MIMKKHLSLIVSMVCLAVAAAAQSNFIPLSNPVEQQFQRDMNRVGSTMHTSFKPFLRADVVDASLPYADSAALSLRDYGHLYDSLTSIPVRQDKKFNSSWLGRKLFTEHLLQVEDEDYRIYLDPVFEGALGRDAANDSMFYYNTRGVWVNGSIGKRFGFNATFYENQGKLPAYLDSAVRKSRVVPGQGRVKRFETSSFDYAFATGSINFRLNRHFTFEFGQDRHFIGDGYRSLLLSDNAFHYPYVKIVTDVWKIRYVNLFMELRNLDRVDNNDEYPFQSKYASMHYLDLNLGKRWSIGVFESVIWHADSGASRGFDFGYMNPFIFLRPVEFSIGSPDNVLMGLNLKFRINDKNLLYAQLMLDEFLLDNVKSGKGWWGNKQGLQGGFKSFDVFGVKNLYLQGELNYVRPYTYQHRDEIGSYSHHRQPLAHPLGANFWEAIGIVKYQHKRWVTDMRCSYAVTGVDTGSSNWGQNVFLSYQTREQEFDNRIAQGLETRIIWVEWNLSYVLNPVSRFSVFTNIGWRNQQQEGVESNSYLIQAGITTRLFNRYYDF